jgi:hypothetical protein
VVKGRGGKNAPWSDIDSFFWFFGETKKYINLSIWILIVVESP